VSILQNPNPVSSRYLLQCLSEIEALHVESLIYLCWRPDVSTVFRVKRNDELFERAMDLAREIYGVKKPPKTSKLSPGVNDLKQGIVAASSSVEMIGQFQSLTLSDSCINRYDNIIHTTHVLQATCNSVVDIHIKCYEIRREKASVGFSQYMFSIPMYMFFSFALSPYDCSKLCVMSQCPPEVIPFAMVADGLCCTESDPNANKIFLIILFLLFFHRSLSENYLFVSTRR
jgi:hypothetical protein